MYIINNIKIYKWQYITKILTQLKVLLTIQFNLEPPLSLFHGSTLLYPVTQMCNNYITLISMKHSSAQKYFCDTLLFSKCAV